MASSGTFNFDPAIAELIEEAAERAGIEPSTLGQSHLKSIFRSMKFMLNSEWSTIGVRQWMIEQGQQVLTTGLRYFELPLGTIDVIAAVLRRQGQDTEMNMVSRNDYLTIVDKTNSGRPDRFYVERRAGRKVMWIWQASENATDIIVYDYFKQIEDVGSSMQGTLQLPTYAQDAFVAGLAAAIARKFNRQFFTDLQVEYRGADPAKIGGKLELLRQEDRERGDIETSLKFEPRTSRSS